MTSKRPFFLPTARPTYRKMAHTGRQMHQPSFIMGLPASTLLGSIHTKAMQAII